MKIFFRHIKMLYGKGHKNINKLKIYFHHRLIDRIPVITHKQPWTLSVGKEESSIGEKQVVNKYMKSCLSSNKNYVNYRSFSEEINKKHFKILTKCVVGKSMQNRNSYTIIRFTNRNFYHFLKNYLVKNKYKCFSHFGSKDITY